VFLNTSKSFTTVSEDTPLWTIVLLLSSKRGGVKLNWVSTFSGEDQGVVTDIKDKQAFGLQTIYRLMTTLTALSFSLSESSKASTVLSKGNSWVIIDFVLIKPLAIKSTA